MKNPIKILVSLLLLTAFAFNHIEAKPLKGDPIECVSRIKIESKETLKIEKQEYSNYVASMKCESSGEVRLIFMFTFLRPKEIKEDPIKKAREIFESIPENANVFASAELLMRMFTAEIQPLLFRSNNFLSRARNDDAFVKYNTVELAHSGTIPAATVNRNVLPATIAPRTDAPTNYPIEEISVDPVIIGNSEEMTIAYNKRQSVLEQQALVIMQKCGDRALQKWSAGADSTRILASTGSARAAGNTNGAQTGNRKAFTIADLTNVQRIFFKDNVSNELEAINGVAIITPSQYQDLMQIANFSQYLQYGSAILPEGVMRRAFGFDFYVRNLSVNLDNSAVLKAEGAAGATTDQDAAVFFHPNYVRRAVGPYMPLFDQGSGGNGKPEYYGSLFSAMIRFGAAAARNDNKGVVLLYESN